MATPKPSARTAAPSDAREPAPSAGSPAAGSSGQAQAGAGARTAADPSAPSAPRRNAQTAKAAKTAKTAKTAKIPKIPKTAKAAESAGPAVRTERRTASAASAAGATALLRVGSALTLETRTGALASQRWVALLAAIGATRSISAAARDVGLSYKAAWDAVDTMNNLSDRALVERSKGGKGGGGTRLTARGEQLVATFRAVEQEHARFMAAINARLTLRDHDLSLLGRFNMLTSARNQFAGRVTRVQRGAVNDEIELEIAGGARLVAVVTRASTENLGLAVGAEAIAMIKASWVLIGVEDDGPALRLSARNQLPGRVSRLTPGAVNTEVVLELAGGNTVAAIITNEAVRQLALAEGREASAIFKASSVILGVAG